MTRHWTKSLFNESLRRYYIDGEISAPAERFISHWTSTKLESYPIETRRVAATIIVYTRWRLASIGLSSRIASTDICAGCILCEKENIPCEKCPIQTCYYSKLAPIKKAPGRIYLDFRREAEDAGLSTEFVPGPNDRVL